MADLYTTLMELIQKLSAGGPKLYQPGTVTKVYADGRYEVAGPSGPRLANPETDLPMAVGQQVWISDVWILPSYDLATGVYTPGRLIPGHFDSSVVHGPRAS